jgi:pimeloyl-ACP methyl ester carboxylesterase
VARKDVYLIPGFGASDLGILSDGTKVWWDPSANLLIGIVSMRLAHNGVDPDPPDGRQLGVDPVGQHPWPIIRDRLQAQLANLDPFNWNVAVGTYDWRLDLFHHAQDLSESIMAHSTPALPATIVGHSAGGIIAVMAWSILLGFGRDNLVRRIITIGTPFQGTYLPMAWLTGTSASVQQLTSLLGVAQQIGVRFAQQWTLDRINSVVLTWPSFYQLFPSLLGTEAAVDPNRALLYQSGNYPAGLPVQQSNLSAAKLITQPLLAAPETHPPSWVMTSVYSSSLETFSYLITDRTPIDLRRLGVTSAGDGTVTAASAQRSPGLLVETFGAHGSVPLAIATDGLLAKLILDPRGPVDPPPPPMVFQTEIAKNVTDPPQSDPVDGLVCLGGG